jgi:hypothetical protein
MALFAASRRDLDAWAVCLGVDNDDDAAARLQNLAARAGAGSEVLGEVARKLHGLRSDEPVSTIQRASARLDAAYDAMAEVLRGFYVHERGR